MKPGKLLHIFAPVAVFAIGIAGFAALHAMKPPPEESEEPPRPVSVFVERVRHADMHLDVVTHGEVRPHTDVELVAQVSGRVVRVGPEFTEGGRFEAGEVLVEIEDTDYRLALEQARADVADAELALARTLAAADVARRQLAGNGAATPLGLHEPQVKQARTRLDAARARLEQARLDLRRTRISLPFPGRIRDTDVNVGEFLQPGARLGRAFATDLLEVRLPFTDRQLASLGLPLGYAAGDEPGRAVRLQAVVGGQEQVWQGELVRLDADIDPSTRLVHGLVRVRDPLGEGVSDRGVPLPVGLYVEAGVRGRRVAEARVIPRDALRAGDRVLLVDEDGRLEVRSVEVSHSDRSTAVIGAGLAAGDRVVVSSLRNPVDGMRLNAIPRAEVTATGPASATDPES
ncbi:MAG: efflux RND transporter periplasmic adaptor subunit [Gammaproteobacteria bacterium]|nr:efflux RND transporter periplasmic adaptor subunit [Gammaproteobacteria bacterium]